MNIAADTAMINTTGPEKIEITEITIRAILIPKVSGAGRKGIAIAANSAAQRFSPTRDNEETAVRASPQRKTAQSEDRAVLATMFKLAIGNR